MNFEVGDVVYLKNDVQKLVIETIDDEGVHVIGHDPNGFLAHITYPAACLTAENPFPPAE